MSFPECDKLDAIQEQSNAILEFMEWVRNTKGLVVCRRMNGQTRLDDPLIKGDIIKAAYLPQVLSMDSLMYEYFGIDKDKLDEERRLLLIEEQQGEAEA